MNDPSTAYTCVQQLGRLLVCALGRHNPSGTGPGVTAAMRVHMPIPSFERMLHHAVTQLRHMSRSDYAVSLALYDILRDLALETTHRDYLDSICAHADQLHATRANPAFSESDRSRFDHAWTLVRDAVDRQRTAAAVAQ